MKSRRSTYTCQYFGACASGLLTFPYVSLLLLDEYLVSTCCDLSSPWLISVRTYQDLVSLV